MTFKWKEVAFTVIFVDGCDLNEVQRSNEFFRKKKKWEKSLKNALVVGGVRYSSVDWLTDLEEHRFQG